MKQLSLLLLVLLAVVPLIQGCVATAAPTGTDPTSLQLTAATCNSNFNCAPGTAAVGQFVKITAHVIYTGNIAPTKEICILDDGSPVNCGLTPVKDETWFTNGMAAGTHILTATYSGDSVHAKSKSTSVTVNVGPDASSTSTTPSTSSPAPPSQPSPPQLTVNPSSLNFGSIDTGNSNSLSATLTNSGNSSATISSVSVSGPGFNTTGLAGIILSPGQTANVNVTFAPSGSGTASGSVVVISNAASSPTISLSGTGVQPPTVTSITVTPANQTVPTGTQVQFKALDNLGNDITSSVIWSSSNSSIVSISATGLATGLEDGVVTIVAIK